NPQIVFLDEPTIGLDVAVKQSIRDFVRRINKERGVTVILTTHDLRDIEELCSRILMIDKGKLIFNGSLEQLRDKSMDSAQLTFSLSHEIEKDWQAGNLPQHGVIWKAKAAKLTAILGRDAPQRADVIRAI